LKRNTEATKEKGKVGAKRTLTDSENRAPLVLVREESEALGFSGALVAHEVHVDHLTVPAKGADRKPVRSPCRHPFQREGRDERKA